MKKALLNITIMLLSYLTYSQTPEIQWSSVFGGEYDDIAINIDITPDGGYIIAGYTESKDTNDIGYHVKDDVWIVKIDKYGNLEWERSYGGTSSDRANGIKATADGGYIFAGESSSIDGDVSGNHGGSDSWIVKLNETGNIEWQKCYGGSSSDVAKDIIQTSDGGYFVLSQSLSSDGDLSGNNGAWDIWCFKLNESGQIEWQKNYGGNKFDIPNCIEQTSDGGFVIAGYTASLEGDFVSNNGGRDYLVLELTPEGSIKNHREFGGSNYDVANSIQQTADGGYIVAGFSNSNDGNVSNNNGSLDYWIIRLNSMLEIEWENNFGGSNEDMPGSIYTRPDGGYIVAGGTKSVDGDVSENHGEGDIWLIGIDNSGNLEWQKCFGGTDYDMCMALQKTEDNDYVLGGSSMSEDGDVHINNGFYDIWLINVTIPNAVINIDYEVCKIYPNPTNNKLMVTSNNEIEELRVYNSRGQLVLRTKPENGNIDISGIPKGAYIVEIISIWEIVTKKLIIE